MNEQPPQPAVGTILRIQQEELNRVNDNRIYLMSLLEDVKAGANQEIARLNAVIVQLKDMLSADAVDEAEAIITGQPTQD